MAGLIVVICVAVAFMSSTGDTVFVCKWAIVLQVESAIRSLASDISISLCGY